jgi:hypothetical protein
VREKENQQGRENWWTGYFGSKVKDLKKEMKDEKNSLCFELTFQT